MNRFQARAAQVPRALQFLVAAPCLGLAVYWWVTYSGLYRWAAEWQLHRFGSYYMKYTGLVVIFAALIPGAILIQIIGGLRGAERGAAEAARLAEEGHAQAQAFSDWMRQHRMRLVGVLLTVGFIGFGGYQAASGALAGARVDVDVGALERGDPLPGRHARLSGELLLDASVGVSTKGSRTTQVYIPVVSKAWRPGKPVRVYLETYESWLDRYADDLATGQFDGMLSSGGLPGLAISAFADRGAAVVEPYWVLDWRTDPVKRKEKGLTFLALGAGIGLLTALVWLIYARRAQKTA